MSRQTIRLPDKVAKAKRDAVVAPVRRTSRYFVYVYGKDGPKKAHDSIESARAEAERLVSEGLADHAFILHIVESAKTAEKAALEKELYGA